MATYRMQDGTIVDTTRASQSWNEVTDHDGRNQISRATADQWTHQMLYRSRRGRYYLVHSSQWQGSRSHAEWVSEHEAVRWLVLMDHAIPAELATLADEVTE